MGTSRALAPSVEPDSKGTEWSRSKWPSFTMFHLSIFLSLPFLYFLFVCDCTGLELTESLILAFTIAPPIPLFTSNVCESLSFQIGPYLRLSDSFVQSIAMYHHRDNLFKLTHSQPDKAIPNSNEFICLFPTCFIYKTMQLLVSYFHHHSQIYLSVYTG